MNVCKQQYELLLQMLQAAGGEVGNLLGWRG